MLNPFVQLFFPIGKLIIVLDEVIIIGCTLIWWVARILCFADLMLAVNACSHDLNTDGQNHSVDLILAVLNYPNHQSAKLKSAK